MGRQGEMFYRCSACIPTVCLFQAVAQATQEKRDLKMSAFQLCIPEQQNKSKLNQNCFVTQNSVLRESITKQTRLCLTWRGYFWLPFEVGMCLITGFWGRFSTFLETPHPNVCPSRSQSTLPILITSLWLICHPHQILTK